MNTKQEYDIITGQDAHDLRNRVNAALSRNLSPRWECQGGPAVDRNGYPFQAITRMMTVAGELE